MTAPPRLTDSSDRPFPLDRQLASGGEGAVYLLPNNPAHVAKVYHKPPSPQTVEKLIAMVGLVNHELLNVAAWPSALLFVAGSRQVAGFVMPRLTDCQPIQHLYNPVMRLKHFPNAGWTFQLRTALNAAAAFDEVHKAGCLVGDVNQSNAQVTPQATVRLIDCDSFQVRANGKQYLCEVGVPHYTPPELQGKSFRGLVRTENHDRFGLAVFIYQLLFVGRHPYAGVFRGSGDPSFEELISQFRFAQGPQAHAWQMGPPPHTPTFADIPPDLGMLFRRAFERGSENGTRPRPGEWMVALKELEKNTTECPTDPGHKHWRGQAKCVWCRLADGGGPEYYFGVGGGASGFSVDESKLQEVLGRLAGVQRRDFPYEQSRYEPAERSEPEPLPEGLAEHRTTAIVLAVAIGLCLLVMPFGLFRGFICLIGVLGALVFGVWLLILRVVSPWHREYRRRRRAKSRAEDDLSDLEAEWDMTVRRYWRDHADLSRGVRDAVSVCRGLSATHQVELQRLAGNAEAMARARHLRLHSLLDATIPKVGVGRKQLLIANGVTTAADVDRNRIRNISGFGDALTGNVIAWRDEVLRQFRFDPRSGVSPADHRVLAVRFRARQQTLLSDAERVLGQLEKLAPHCKAALTKLEPDLRTAVAEWEQADADLRVLTKRG